MKLKKRIAAIGALVMMISACVSGASAADTESFMYSKSQTYKQLTDGDNACYRTMVNVKNPRTQKSVGKVKGSYTTLVGAKTTTYSDYGSCASHQAIISSGGDSKYGKEVNSRNYSETSYLYKWGWNPTYSFKGIYTYYK